MRKMIDYIKTHKMAAIIVAFAVWMLFLDRNSMIMHIERDRAIMVMQDSIDLYKEKIEKEKEYMRSLETDPKALEIFAREKYHLKRPDEDVFMIRHE